MKVVFGGCQPEESHVVSASCLNDEQWIFGPDISSVRTFCFPFHVRNTEVMLVILSDLVFFLAENAQKYTFFSQDNKVGTWMKFQLRVLSLYQSAFSYYWASYLV